MVGLGMLFIGSTLVRRLVLVAGHAVSEEMAAVVFRVRRGLGLRGERIGLGRRGSGTPAVDRLSRRRMRRASWSAACARRTACPRWSPANMVLGSIIMFGADLRPAVRALGIPARPGDPAGPRTDAGRQTACRPTSARAVVGDHGAGSSPRID